MNSGIIGSLCRAFDIVPFALVLGEIEAEFATKRPQANSGAAKLVYEKTIVRDA